jgi:LPS sulfotransferase NodH
MLATALKQHPQLSVAGEILQRPYVFGLGKGDNTNVTEESLIHDAVERFNGFIIHRQHVRALRLLRAIENINVIFLTRRDWLAQLASDLIAMRTNVWHIADGPNDYLSNDGAPVHLANPPNVAPTIEQCFSFVREQTQLELMAVEQLRQSRMLFLTYEELQQQWASNMGKVLSFLGVEDVLLEPVTRKQELRTPRQVVTNFDEIRAAFRGSPWELPGDGSAFAGAAS